MARVPMFLGVGRQPAKPSTLVMVTFWSGCWPVLVTLILTMYELPTTTDGQLAPGLKKLAPPLVLTCRSHAMFSGRTITLFVSLALTVCPRSVTPEAVTTSSVFWQWLTAGTTHWAVAPTAKMAGNPQAPRFKSGSGTLLSETVNANGTLPVFLTVIR